jgi:predicted enzyme involved in methoxymalonyl-ACP biosynthesis
MCPIALKNLRCFDAVHVSDEDLQRTRMYHQERQRTAAFDAAGSRDTWLRSLGMKVRIRALDSDDLSRATQLLNKTNQFNLTSRRLTQATFADWANQPCQTVLTFQVEDRFGTCGLVGLLGLCVQAQDARCHALLAAEEARRPVELDPRVGRAVSNSGIPASGQPSDASLRIVDWVISCRVLGRGLEETMLAAAAAFARRADCRRIVATYLPTPRNAPILTFLQGLPDAQRCGEDFIFSPDNWNTPDYVAVFDESACLT